MEGTVHLSKVMMFASHYLGPYTSHVPKDTIHTLQRALAFHYAFNRGKSQSEVELEVGLYGHSPY